MAHLCTGAKIFTAEILMFQTKGVKQNSILIRLAAKQNLSTHLILKVGLK